jgi:hypothetical protein
MWASRPNRSGSVTSASNDARPCWTGQSVFITPEEGAITFTGVGTVFVAAPGAPAEDASR